MEKIIGKYQNGNYEVTLYADGTKVRENDLDNLTPSFAESCDVTITQRCDGNCKFCYAECTPDGKHAELLNAKFLDTLHPYTEMALNGNDLSHPELEAFLKLLRSKKVIPNMTVNQRHFMKHFDTISRWLYNKLIFGLGVSYAGIRDNTFIKNITSLPNAVIHTINGILTPKDVVFLGGNSLKLLILGYKNKGRGISWYNADKANIDKNMDWLKSHLKDITKYFKVVSFDNLALEQLDVKNTLNIDDSLWNELYMGDEGSCTFFIDMVNKTFAKSSLETKSYPIKDSIDEMFDFIRKL